MKGFLLPEIPLFLHVHQSSAVGQSPPCSSTTHQPFSLMPGAKVNRTVTPLNFTKAYPAMSEIFIVLIPRVSASASASPAACPPTGPDLDIARSHEPTVLTNSGTTHPPSNLSLLCPLSFLRWPTIRLDAFNTVFSFTPWTSVQVPLPAYFPHLHPPRLPCHT